MRRLRFSFDLLRATDKVKDKSKKTIEEKKMKKNNMKERLFQENPAATHSRNGR